MNYAEAMNGSNAQGASACKGSGVAKSAHASGVYTATLGNKDGNAKWEDTIENWRVSKHNK